MKKRILSLVFALCLMMAMTASVHTVNAQSFDNSVSLVMDGAGLLTSGEVDELNERLQTISSTYNAQIVVATTASSEGSDVDTYIEYVYDSLNLGYGSTRDGVLLLVCMDQREYRILTNGMADDAIGSGGIDMIGDYIVSDLSDGNYADAFHAFADECEYYLNGYINGFPFDAGATLLTAIIIGLVVGVIVALVLKGQLKSVRQQNEANVYVKPGSMQLTISNDLFLYRTVDRRKKESSSGSSGSSGSSRSVGGGSF